MTFIGPTSSVNVGDQLSVIQTQHRCFDDDVACLGSIQMWFLGVATHHGYEPTQAQLYSGKLERVQPDEVTIGLHGSPNRPMPH